MPAGEVAIFSSTNEVDLVVRLAFKLLAVAHHAREQLRVSIAGAHSGLARLSAQTVSGLGAAGEHRVGGRPQRRVPLERGQAELCREPRVALGLLAPLDHLPELEQVGDAPVVGLELGGKVTGRPGGGNHRVGYRKALLDAIRPPQRDMSRAQRRSERAWIARPAGRRDGVGAMAV